MSMVEVNMSDDGQVHNKGKSLWIWLAIPPLAAVVGAIITIYLALAYPDPVIKAPINKLGKVMVQDQASIEMARNLGLSARFQRSAGGQIHLYLSGQSQAESLELLWLHATREEWDRVPFCYPLVGQRANTVVFYLLHPVRMANGFCETPRPIGVWSRRLRMQAPPANLN